MNMESNTITGMHGVHEDGICSNGGAWWWWWPAPGSVFEQALNE